MEEIEFKDFAIKFGGLKQNKLNPNADWNTSLYDSTQINERIHVMNQVERDYSIVWTLLKYGTDYVIKSGDVVNKNRIGNIITKKQWMEKQEYKIKSNV